MDRRRKHLILAGVVALLMFISTPASAQNYAFQVNLGRVLNAADAEKAEDTLSSNPRDVLARARLIGYYSQRIGQDPAARTARLRHIEWFVRNAPDASVLSNIAARLQPADFAGPNSGLLESLRAAWQDQVAQHLNDPLVIENAWQSAGSIEVGINGGERAAEYLKRLRMLEPGDPQWALDLAGLYALALPRGMAPNAPADAKRAADRIAADLEASTDAAVVGLAAASVYESGRMLPNQGAVARAGAPLFERSQALLRHASMLNPKNPAWANAVSAPAPANAAAFGAMLTGLLQISDLWPGGLVRAIEVPPGGTRLSAAEEAAKRPSLDFGLFIPNLPADCSVQFNALIAADGKVKNLQVVSFDHLSIPFISARRNALRQVQYPPTTVNGKPVDAVTDIDVKCPKQSAFPVVGGVVGGLSGVTAPPAPPPPPPPPPPPSRQVSLTIGKAAAATNLLTSVPPEYPSIARSGRIQGVVVLSVTIDKAGKVTAMRTVSTPSPLLVQAAVDAVKQWTYKPYVVNGMPVDVSTTVDVPFTATQ